MNGTSTATLTSTHDFSQVLSTALRLDHAAAVEFDLPLHKVEPQTEAPLTFDGLCRIEQGLLALFNEAGAIKDDKRKSSFCANHIWYAWHGLRERMTSLVGYAVKRREGDPRLATSRSYDLAYRAIYDALPDCRNCTCYEFQAIIDQGMGR